MDDLKFLRKGGRVSAVAAIAGTLLNIKPVLWANDTEEIVNKSTSLPAFKEGVTASSNRASPISEVLTSECVAPSGSLQLHLSNLP